MTLLEINTKGAPGVGEDVLDGRRVGVLINAGCLDGVPADGVWVSPVGLTVKLLSVVTGVLSESVAVLVGVSRDSLECCLRADVKYAKRYALFVGSPESTSS